MLEYPPILFLFLPFRDLLVNEVLPEQLAQSVYQGDLGPKGHLALLARKEPL